MTSENLISLEADDCLPFKEGYGNVIQHLAKRATDFELFHFGSSNRDTPPIVEFDPKIRKWKAGRLVGDIRFEYENREYVISINPRFGQLHLFRMLEEIFNVRITESKHAYDRSKSKQQLIRKLISFLWLHLLAKGNRHGLPRVSQYQSHHGSKIRGRINVRDSLIPLKTEQKLVSIYRKKGFDDSIVQLLKGAYEVLLSDYHLGEIKQPYNAKHALDQLNTITLPVQKLRKSQYKTIKVKRIYKLFKPVINLSWDIIRNNHTGDQRKTTEQSFSYFIDMAEIWEMYLRSLLKNRLSKYGWELWDKTISTYPDRFFERKLIPDIVFHRDGKLLVFDAKYKRMKFEKWDVDRSDFFQIHTYIQYFQQSYDVVAGGLLYPFSKDFNEDEQMKSWSTSLFDQDEQETKFVIDGIDLKGCPSDDFDFGFQEEKFVERITKIIL